MNDEAPARAEADRASEALLRHSTTAGIRRQSAERYTLARRELKVDAGDEARVPYEATYVFYDPAAS